MVRAAGVEPTTFGSGGRHSIQLSYARNVVSLRAAPPGLNRNLFPVIGRRRVLTHGKMLPAAGAVRASLPHD